jgi:hypothetical protein
MRTRTLLLLSVATALAILLAGGVLLIQLAGQQEALEASAIGETVRVGDAAVTVHGARADGDRYLVDVELGGVDDLDGTDGFRLVTGGDGPARTLAPLTAPEPGRCTAITVEPQRCVLEFDVSRAETDSRVLVLDRGEDRATWTFG